MKGIDARRDAPRFWSKVDVRAESVCWNWRGALGPYGYGAFHPLGAKTALGAHRIAYFLYFGVDPGELFVCHHCDNRLCCNPNHHFLGDVVANNLDRWEKWRVREGRPAPTKRVGPPRRGKGRSLTASEIVEVRESPLSLRQEAKRLGVSLHTVRHARLGLGYYSKPECLVD